MMRGERPVHTLVSNKQTHRTCRKTKIYKTHLVEGGDPSWLYRIIDAFIVICHICRRCYRNVKAIAGACPSAHAVIFALFGVLHDIYAVFPWYSTRAAPLGVVGCQRIEALRTSARRRAQTVVDLFTMQSFHLITVFAVDVACSATLSPLSPSNVLWFLSETELVKQKLEQRPESRNACSGYADPWLDGRPYGDVGRGPEEIFGNNHVFDVERADYGSCTSTV